RDDQQAPRDTARDALPRHGFAPEGTSRNIRMGNSCASSWPPLAFVWSTSRPIATMTPASLIPTAGVSTNGAGAIRSFKSRSASLLVQRKGGRPRVLVETPTTSLGLLIPGDWLKSPPGSGPRSAIVPPERHSTARRPPIASAVYPTLSPGVFTASASLVV